MSQENQIVQSSNLVLEFEREIPQELRSSFGDYFFGIKDFIHFCFDKNIALSIEVNGKLIIKVFSKDASDKYLVEVAFSQFVDNLSYLFKGKKPFLDLPNDVSIKDLDKALIVLDSKLSILQMNIKLNSVQSIQTEFNDVKTLVESVIDTTKKVIKDYTILKNENSDLYQKLEQVYVSLKESRSKNLLVDGKIDSLLSYMSLLSQALESKQIDQINSMKQAINDFWLLNQEKLKLISIGGTTLYNLIKILIDLF